MTDWHTIKDRVYRRGSRISETMLKKAGVPAYAKTIEEMAAKASAGFGLPNST